MTQPSPDTSAPAPSGSGLRKNALGPFDAIAQSVSTMAPTATAAMTVPLVYSSAGNGTWLSYILATVCTLVVAQCIARFARDSSSPGSLYVYTTDTLPPVPGAIAAWSLLLAYVASGASVVGGFVHYANVVLGAFAGTTLSAIPLGLACIALSVWVAYRDVKVSASLMLTIELVSVLVISVVFALLLSGTASTSTSPSSRSGASTRPESGSVWSWPCSASSASRARRRWVTRPASR